MLSPFSFSRVISFDPTQFSFARLQVLTSTLYLFYLSLYPTASLIGRVFFSLFSVFVRTPLDFGTCCPTPVFSFMPIVKQPIIYLSLVLPLRSEFPLQFFLSDLDPFSWSFRLPLEEPTSNFD